MDVPKSIPVDEEVSDLENQKIFFTIVLFPKFR